MSRRTLTKIIRTHEKYTDKDGVEHIVKRDAPLPPLEDKVSVCFVCGGEMLVSDGQLKRYHRECRKYRHRSYGSIRRNTKQT